MTTPATIAAAFRRLGMLSGKRALRMEYGEKWCAAHLGDDYDFQLLVSEALNSGAAAEGQVLAWIDNPAMARQVLSKLTQHRQPQTVMEDDQQRGDVVEAEWRNMTVSQLRAWKWRRYLAEQVSHRRCPEAVAEENHTTVEQVAAAVAEFAGVSA